MNKLILAAFAPALLGAAQAAGAWSPSPSVAAQLAPLVTEPGFQVRPPFGYTGPHKSSIQVIIYRWNGPEQSDGHCVFLTVASILRPPETPKRTLSQMFAGMMSVVREDYVNLKVAPAQIGLIHGIPFLRCYWTGTDKEDGRKMRGFEYVGQAGATIYDLSADGSASYNKSQLQIAEASALTFQKK